MVRFPQQFLNNKYIKFAGWMLSDIDPAVRLEAATVLTSVYDSVRHTPAGGVNINAVTCPTHH